MLSAVLGQRQCFGHGRLVRVREDVRSRWQQHGFDLYNSSAGGTHCSSAHRHQRRRCAGCLHPDVNVCTPYCTKGLAVCTQLPPAAATQHLACICYVCAAAFPVRGPHAPASNFAQQILQQATFLRYHCYRTRWKEAAVPPSGPVCWQQALCQHVGTRCAPHAPATRSPFSP